MSHINKYKQTVTEGYTDQHLYIFILPIQPHLKSEFNSKWLLIVLIQKLCTVLLLHYQWPFFKFLTGIRCCILSYCFLCDRRPLVAELLADLRDGRAPCAAFSEGPHQPKPADGQVSMERLQLFLLDTDFSSTGEKTQVCLCSVWVGTVWDGEPLKRLVSPLSCCRRVTSALETVVCVPQVMFLLVFI